MLPLTQPAPAYAFPVKPRHSTSRRAGGAPDASIRISRALRRLGHSWITEAVPGVCESNQSVDNERSAHMTKQRDTRPQDIRLLDGIRRLLILQLLRAGGNCQRAARV